MQTLVWRHQLDEPVSEPSRNDNKDIEGLNYREFSEMASQSCSGPATKPKRSGMSVPLEG